MVGGISHWSGVGIQIAVLLQSTPIPSSTWWHFGTRNWQGKGIMYISYFNEGMNVSVVIYGLEGWGFDPSPVQPRCWSVFQHLQQETEEGETMSTLSWSHILLTFNLMEVLHGSFFIDFISNVKTQASSSAVLAQKGTMALCPYLKKLTFSEHRLTLTYYGRLCCPL